MYKTGLRVSDVLGLKQDCLVKLNNKFWIETVQELLAHASPEMTMRYARLLYDTKRKTFDNAVKQGVFSFDESFKLKEENNREIPSDVLDMLWTNHKLK